MSTKIREISRLLEHFTPLWYNSFDKLEFDEGVKIYG